MQTDDLWSTSLSSAFFLVVNLMNFLGIAGDYVFDMRSLVEEVPLDLPAGAALGDGQRAPRGAA